MPIEAVAPRRLYRQVADQLRALMDSGEFAVGSRLPPERDLAAKLGISRATVREALIALEVDGRVRIRVGSGIYVLPPPAEAPVETAAPIAGPFDILAARALIEGEVAAEAARRAGPADIAALNETLAAMREGAQAGREMFLLDRAFHTALAQILGNDAITRVVGDLFDQRINPYFAQLAGYFETAETWRRALEEHAAVRDAIAAGAPERARAAMRLHLSNSQKRFTESFGNDGNGPAPKVMPSTTAGAMPPLPRRSAMR